MASCVHALRKRNVVAILCLVPGYVAGARPDKAASQQPYARTDCGIRSVAAYRGARKCAECRADDRALHCRVLLRPRCGLPTYRLVGVLPAPTLVGSELIEALARTRQYHHAGTGRHAD